MWRRHITVGMTVRVGGGGGGIRLMTCKCLYSFQSHVSRPGASTLIFDTRLGSARCGADADAEDVCVCVGACVRACLAIPLIAVSVRLSPNNVCQYCRARIIAMCPICTQWWGKGEGNVGRLQCNVLLCHLDGHPCQTRDRGIAVFPDGSVVVRRNGYAW